MAPAHTLLFTTSLAAVFAISPAAQEASAAWPDFRGPSWDGHAASANVPLEWSADKNIAWKTDLPGTGWSTPVIAGDRIWLTTAAEDGKTMSVVAVNSKSGAIEFNRVVFTNDDPARRNGLNSYASPSPVIEPGRVYVHFGTYGTACLDTESAETVWERRDLNCDHMEGPGSSPVIWSQLLIFNVDGGDVQYVVALDKTTGETQWKVERSEDLDEFPPDFRKAYSTPILLEVDGKTLLISSGAQATMAYDPESGEEIWKVKHRGFSMSSRPVANKDLLFLNTGFMRPQILAVRPKGHGDITEDSITWSYHRGVPTMSSALLIDERLYFVSDGGVASCLNADTGELVWRERIGGQHCSSPIYAAGRIYFFDRTGKTVVIAPNDEFTKLGTNELGDGFMASPAVLGDAFILRSKTALYRVETETE